MVNLANGPNEVVYEIIYDKYGKENEPNEPSPAVLEFLVRALQSDIPARKHGALWLIANSCGESQDVARLIT